MSAKLCYITAIYGDYEKSAKWYPEQTVKADFICFTDKKDIINNDWILDYTPYHLTHKSELDDDQYVNSLSNNMHDCNVAKYYKQQFYRIPRLKQYDIIVWLDGSVQIYNPRGTEIILKKMTTEKMICFEHHFMYGSLKNEVLESSKMERYNTTMLYGKPQPPQNILKQYQDYLEDGYDEEYFKRYAPNREHMGVYVTCMVAFRNDDEEIKEFLDLWYLQTLNHTMADQIGFSYAAQKLNLIPHALPDDDIKGNYLVSDFHTKCIHGSLP